MRHHWLTRDRQSTPTPASADGAGRWWDGVPQVAPAAAPVIHASRAADLLAAAPARAATAGHRHAA